ncbi:MAG TPA: hypothetical protein VIB48_09380 [Acidimicrobiia bacterium]|jgi:hypothetical protein
MTRPPDPNPVPGLPSGTRRAAALRTAGRALLLVLASALVAGVAARELRPPPSPHPRVYGAALAEPGPTGRRCPDALDAACARAVGTRVGVTVAWLPDGDGWRGAGMQSGGSGAHGWATQTLRTEHATLTLTSNSPAAEVGEPASVPGATGLTVRVADGGERVQLVWSRSGTRYVADARADGPATLGELGALVDTWHRIRYASPVTGWS